MDIRLDGKHALVCGSTQGIGRAVALQLAKLGARVTLLARDEVKLRSMLDQLDRSDGQIHGMIAVDMADTGALSERLREHLANNGVDILVNNTGGPPPGPAHEAAVEDYANAFRLHVLSHQTMVLAVVPGMKTRRHGRIINVISTGVKQPVHDLGVSNTVRGAVANWAKTLANELGPYGITVNNVLPGATDTGRLAALLRRNAAKKSISEGEATKEMLSDIPLGRFAKPEETAFAVAFLAGPCAASINGINLPVDGGRTASL